MKGAGSVVTWGHEDGDSSAVHEQLLGDVQQIWRAFVAVKDDASVLAWGHDDRGGDSSVVREHLQLIALGLRGRAG